MDQGRLVEAEQALRLTLKMRERALGAENPDTLESCYNLAVTLGGQKKYPEALLLAQRTETGRIKVLGGAHPMTYDSRKFRESIEAELKQQSAK